MPFSEYAGIFEPIFYHVKAVGSSNEVTDVRLVSCKASHKDGYSDHKSGALLLCPDSSAFEPSPKIVEGQAVEDNDSKDSSSSAVAQDD